MAVLKYKNGEGNFVTLTNYTVTPITAVQTTGDSLTDIMSQKAVSDEVNKKVNETELNGKIADAISGNPTVKNAIADVIGDNPAISGAVEDIAEGVADAKIDAYDAVAEGKFAAKDHNHDGVYAPLSHTHSVADINNFSDEVADAVKAEITNNNSAITESIENVVEKYIYGGDAPSSATVITTENMETELGDYAKKTDIPTVVSAFENDAAYVTSGDVANQININSGTVENIIKNYVYGDTEPSADAEVVTTDNLNTTLADYAKKGDNVSEFANDAEYVTSGAVSAIVETSIAENEAVKQAIANAIADDDSIQQAIENAVAGELDKKADTSAVTASIEAATSGKVDTTAFNTYSGEVQTELNSKFDGASYDSNTKKIEFKNGETVLAEIDATDFIKDGMVDNVEISGSNLVVTFNTDAGKEAISIALTDIFDPSNYYNKTEADGKFLTISSAETLYVANDDFDNKVKGVLDDSAEVSGSVVDIIENYITGASSNIYTKEEANGAFQAKGDYVSASTLDGYYTKEELTGSSTTVVVTKANSAATAAVAESANYATSAGTVDASNVNGLDSAISGAIKTNQDVKNEVISAVTASTEFTTVTNNIESISGSVSGINNTLTAHTADTDIHVTAAEKQAWNAKSNFSGSYNDLEDVPSTFTPSAHEHASNEITSMSGYTKPNTTSAIETSDTLNQAIGKLEKAVETATAGGVNSVSLTSGTNNGTLKLTVNTTETDNIAVTGLGGAAFLNTGTTVGTVADGGHHHNANEINDFDNAVADAVSGNSAVISSITKVITGESAVSGAVETIVNGKLNDYATKAQLTGSSDYLTVTSAHSATNASSAATAAVAESVSASGVNGLNDAIANAVTGNTTVVNNINSAITANTTVQQISGDVNTISGTVTGLSNSVSTLSGTITGLTSDVNTVSGIATSAKAVTDFYVGHNSRTTLADVPTTKRLVIVTGITSSTNALTLNGTLSDGYELHLIIQGTAGVTITIPSAWISLTDTIAIGDNGYCELNIISDGSKLYVRGA